ncbi:anhydro-N-acetylmuramic acid kinase [Lentimicrobium sp. L6]|uniref:anhydro-N-acetylmuramic acid kinase n=1 Tax=Lentimicrobium sp. L6 TaxID=2735916 RepID=UPI0015533ECA|nr:anhydro-N-acetylmuramic acid kinase [Lentimicrobium sp. L6]NPD83569.1 anhydro-N-acetylmuramic acid kinase [Lentimicrobium sp. L6]
MERYNAIGVMSGTSLDGLDIVFAEFFFDGNNWFYQFGDYIEIPYSKKWQNKLSNLAQASAFEFARTHVDFGHYMGKKVDAFIKSHRLEVDVIGVHGHTVFHQPELGFTSQIGDGSAIASRTGLLVANDFRSMDVARGGQGAPLVPIGDALLFSKYLARLNLGGFSNISFGGVDDINAFDICPVNIVMNEITRKQGLEYDEDGKIARNGQLVRELLHKLNQLDYYQHNGPKSLGREWVDECFWPCLSTNISDEDLLRTLVEHTADQIAYSLASSKINSGKVLITGGGAYNSFLIERIRAKISLEIVIPDPILVEMKEALIFAFLGVLRIREQPNILNKVTGAKRDSISGALYKGV